MNYKFLNNRTLELPDASPAEVSFLDRLQAALADESVSHEQFVALVYGVDNPILDHDAVPGHPLVSKATLANPWFRVCNDYITRKQIHCGAIDLAQMQAGYTVDVPTAAEQLGVSPQAVRAGIDSFKYDALFAKGQWWMRPETVASLKLSREGGRLVKVPKPT